MDASHSWEIYPRSARNIIVSCYKSRTRCCKNYFQKIVCKTAQAIEYFIGNKVAGKIVKPEPVLDMNSRNFEEIVIPPEKKQEISNELR